MGANDPMYDSVADPVLNLDLVHDRPSHASVPRPTVPEGYEATYEVMKNWFSMYTKCSDSWIAMTSTVNSI